MPSSRRSKRRPYAEPHQPLDVDRARGAVARVSDSDGAQWSVRRVPGSAKSYRCPGCDQEIAPGTAHVVAWSEDHLMGAAAGVADRRHWHSGCWQARDRRAPR